MLEDDYAPATRSLVPSWLALAALAAVVGYFVIRRRRG
jgi:MYXO-CTERM domain-containing protein